MVGISLEGDRGLNLKIDQHRVDNLEFDLSTGIFVRAQDHTGKWTNADIADLELASLKEWLRSRGGENTWAETTLAMILGFDESEIAEVWNLKLEVKPEDEELKL